MARVNQPVPENASLRDRLAIDRTQLANERTLLAYLRTAIMLIATGATALHVIGGDAGFVLGWGPIAAGGFVAAIGTARFRRLAGSIESAMSGGSSRDD